MTLRTGEQDANQPITIDQLMAAWFDTVYSLTLSIVNDEADAADATQETFIKAARNLATFRGDSSAKTWLCSIAVNEARSLLRRRSSRFRMLDRLRQRVMLGSSELMPEESAEIKATQSALWQAVAQLKEKHRLPIILRYAHGMSTSEIAAVLSISEGTTHSRLYYARQKLLHLLDREEMAALSAKEVR